MKTQDIFKSIQGLNPKQSTVSSLGSFVSSQSEQLADFFFKEIINYIPENTLAHNIMTSNKGLFTEKQLWIIAFELEKNNDFVAKLSADINRTKEIEDAKRINSNNKLKANKEQSSDLLKQVKEAGYKLADYYSFVKSNKKFAREFYSKKFTQESVNEFLNK